MARRNPEIEVQLRKAAAGKTGFRIAQVSGKQRVETVRGVAEDLVKKGVLHRVKVGHRIIMYFGSVRDALAHEQSLRNAPPVVKKAGAKWPHDTPIHYPTNPDGSPAYKVTIAPPPAQPIRTGTHSMWGG